MKIDHTLNFRQQQTLTMTPQLQQSIKLLQMSALEISDYIEEQLLENPLLQKDDRPFSLPEQKGSSEPYEDWIEKTVSENQTLHRHLLQQLSVTSLSNEEKKIAERIIDLIDDDGYVRGQLDELAKELDVDESDLLNLLSVIQTFDPVGVGARNLVECLTLQLKETIEELPKAETILEHLNDYPILGVEKLSKKCHVTLEECQNILQHLRSLNPKPGLNFTPLSTEWRIPDVFIKRDPETGQFVAEINDESLPSILVDSAGYHYYLKASLSNSDREYLKNQYQQANWLMNALYQRVQTLMRVAHALVAHQQLFFEQGKIALRPLTLKDLSQVLEVHESTVSRAMTGKFMSTPQGIVEFKELLSTTVNDDTSAATIQHWIKEFIDGEPPETPLSDDQLVGFLKQKGITVARRTIAKYREQMGIASSFERKRRQIRFGKK